MSEFGQQFWPGLAAGGVFSVVYAVAGLRDYIDSRIKATGEI
jgi:hypothetical protein